MALLDDTAQESDDPPKPRSNLFRGSWFWIVLALTISGLLFFFPAVQAVVGGLSTVVQALFILALPIYFIFKKAQMRLAELMLIVTAMGSGMGLLFRVIHDASGIPHEAVGFAYGAAAVTAAIWGFSGAALGLWMAGVRKCEDQRERLKLVATGLGLPLSVFGFIVAVCYIGGALSQHNPDGVIVGFVLGVIPSILMLIYGFIKFTGTLKIRPATATPELNPSHYPYASAQNAATVLATTETMTSAGGSSLGMGSMNQNVNSAGDVQRRPCPACGEMIPTIARLCRFCHTHVEPVAQAPVVPVAPAAMGTMPPPAPAPAGDATGGVIPYKNAPALIAYYLGVFSIIPCFPIGIAAFVLGIQGLKKAKATPAVRGEVHAWIGIIVGGLFGLLWTIFTVMGIVAAATRR